MVQAAAIYARISRDRDGTMLGVERQREDCAALAERRGWPIAGVYVDNDVSAYSGKKRPEYRRLLEDVRAGRVDAILAWHPDRLHRSPRELEDFISTVDTAGVPVETAQAGLVDLSTPSGRLVARQLGAVSRYESEHKAARIARKHEELAKAGRPILGGTRAFGLTADYRALVPEEAALIREAVERVLQGQSLRGICSDWQARGVQTPTGGHWQQAPLRRLLTSARIAGLREHRGAIVAVGEWPAIIDRPTLERLRAILRDPSRRTTVNARSYLLTGLLRCSACGARLVARPRLDHVRRYVCARGPMQSGCGKVAILAEPLEELVSAMVLEAIDSPALEEAMRQRAAGSGQGGAVESLRADEAALEQLARDHYADRIIGRAEYLAARSAIDARIERARARMAAATGSAAIEHVAGSARRLWPSLDFDRRRAIVSAVLDHVTVGPGRRGYNRFDPSRIPPENVVWRV